MTDPFADDVETGQDNTEAGEQQEATATVWDSPAMQVAGDDSRHSTAILKGGGAYGAGSISIRGANAHDLYEHYSDNRESIRELMKMVAYDNAGFGKAAGFGVDGKALNGNGGSTPANTGSNQKGRPQGAAQAPGGETRQCEHGPMEYKSGFSEKKKQKMGDGNWHAFDCPEGKCDRQWLK